jgi:5-methylcytosine-specific restriction endonuclease McrA
MTEPTSCPIGKASATGYRYGCRCRECREAKRTYRQSRSEVESANFREYYRSVRAHRLASEREWRLRNPDKDAAKSHRRSARRRDAETLQVTARDWRRLCARYDDRCAYCGIAAPLEQDHVVPLIRGGRHSIGNLLPACKPCNSSKRARLLVEWRALRSAA